MKTKFLRAVALAGFSLFATAALVAPTPTFAADKSKDKDAPKVSRTLGKAMGDIQKLLQAKDWPNAIAKLKEVQPNLTEDYDKYVLNTYLAIAQFQSGDHKGAAESFAAAAAAEKVPASDHDEAVHKALMLYSDVKDYPKVVELAQKYYKPDTPLTEDTARLIGAAAFYSNDYPTALSYGRRAIDAGSVGGKVPAREAYELVLLTQSRMKDLPGQIKTVSEMAGLYGSGDDWAHALDFTFSTFQSKNKQANATAAFYLYRLRMIVDADTDVTDYTLAGQLALDQNSPGDAIKAFSTAQARNKFDAKKNGALYARAVQDAKKDQPTLPQAETIATKSPKADPILSVAESYFGYGKYADSERAAQNAVAKGGPKLNQALLLLGAAQTMQNKTAEATATLAKVNADPYNKVAALWSLYANRKYGQAATATPAAK